MTQVRMTELSSLEKGLRILRELASSERGMTAAELAQFAGLNRTTVYRLSEIHARRFFVAAVHQPAIGLQQRRRPR